MPIRLRTKTRIRADMHTNTTPLLALYCHLNDPVARTVLLPESDNCRAYTPAIYRANDRACTPTINRPTDRQALCLTTITTAAGTVLPPGQTAAMLAADSDLTVAALQLTDILLLPPAAKPTPCCLPTAPQAQRKNCQWWNIWTKVT